MSPLGQSAEQKINERVCLHTGHVACHTLPVCLTLKDADTQLYTQAMKYESRAIKRGEMFQHTGKETS